MDNNSLAHYAFLQLFKIYCNLRDVFINGGSFLWASETIQYTFPALTFISPYFNILTAIAAMLASGGNAVVMKKMGEGKEQEARQDFTMLLIVNVQFYVYRIGERAYFRCDFLFPHLYLFGGLYFNFAAVFKP
ncbi:MAG: hypothetical protein PHR92_17220 [Lachnospiraceae bacterium]|nr:hypothetical protein [Lachnospiraceae bacterium]